METQRPAEPHHEAPTEGSPVVVSEAGPLPLVYSCSGASSAAQLANHLAVRLDRSGLAEMSCIAGVGGGVEPLVRTARSGRPLVVLDGCPLRCAAQILRLRGLEPDRHYDLGRMGVKKVKHQDFDPEDARRLLAEITADLASVPPRPSGTPSAGKD